MQGADYQTKKKSGPCFRGTRVALLRRLGHQHRRISDVRTTGLTGIGKSTIATPSYHEPLTWAPPFSHEM
ncbi:hypothetical protein M378DRAFT_157415, partial [Amanita muscaria Koide BX008]